MKIIIEILKESTDSTGQKNWAVEKSKIVNIGTKKDKKTLGIAKDKLQQLKLELAQDEKIRILEFHNDESDEIRTPCKVLYEE